MTEQLIRPQYYSNRQILQMVFPLILSLMIEQLIGFTDVVFLGRVGEVELGASALAGVMYLALIMFGFGYSFSLQAYLGQKNGEKNYLAIGEALHNGSLFLLALATLMMVIAFTCAPPFFEKLCDSPEIAKASEDYLFWRAVGMPFTFLCANFRAFFIAILRPKILTLGSVVMVLANIVFNYVLIFGMGPIPALGIAGAAIASSIAEGLCLVVYVVYAMKFANPERYGLLRPFEWSWPIQVKLFKLGRWLMLQEGLAFTAWLYFFLSVEHLGATALAVSNVVRQISSLFFLFIHSFGSTAGAISANLIGERRFDEIPSVCRRTLGICALVITPFFIGVSLFPKEVLGIFTNIEGIIDNGVPVLYMLLSSLLVAIPAMFYNFAMGAMGLTKETSTASMTAATLYVLYIVLLNWAHANITLMWSSEYAYNIVIGVVCAYFFRQRRWRIV